jgi:hypothetical protein
MGDAEEGLRGARQPSPDVFSVEGLSLREREIKTCVRLRREGYELIEIAARVRRPEDHVRIFIRRRAPELLVEGKAWEAAR